MDADLSITQLAREFGITTRTIRFYEDCGLLKPERAGQRRIYRPTDRRRLQTILRGRRLGFTLEEIRETLDIHHTIPKQIVGPQGALGRIAAHRSRLLVLREDVGIALDWLDHLERHCRQASTTARSAGTV